MHDSKGKQSLPLEGLVILDLTRLQPGPLCTMLLGDYGAEVIKIEDTGAGDQTRSVGRIFEGSGSLFRQLNRNKKSLALNLKSDQGCEVVKKLAAGADVLVESFRPGVMDRLGLNYEALRTINRQLIYASLTGYGREGPYRDRAGHDINYLALSGLIELNAEKGSALKVPAFQVADIAGGAMMATNGIMIALYRRAQTGQGDYVDISITRGLLPCLALAAAGLNSGDDLARRGKGQITGGYGCYNIYETSDGEYFSLGALEPVFWKRFCETAGKPHWIARQFEQEGREELIHEVQALFKTKSRAQWEDLFASVDACCEPVLSLEEAIKHPLNRDDQSWIRSLNSEGEAEIIPGFPLFFSGRPGEMHRPPPRHGQHTAEILLSLGYDSHAISNLSSTGVIKISDK